MAERIVSPGVFQRETDESFISPLPVEVGAAIIGPTVKGPVEQPTVVTSFSDYRNKFGTTFFSGSDKYEFLTSIAAQKFFANGGNSMLVTRVVSGTFDSAESTNVLASSSLNQGGATATSSFDFATTDNLEGIRIVDAGGSTDLLIYSASSNTQIPSLNIYSYNTTDLQGLVDLVNSSGSAVASASFSGTNLFISGATGGTAFNGYTVLTGSLEEMLASTDSLQATLGGGLDATLNSDAQNVFTLKTIGKGIKFNNSTATTDPGTEYSDGSLVSGSTDNLRWEVSGLNTTAGTFNSRNKKRRR
jgi:hypothetical protein